MKKWHVRTYISHGRAVADYHACYYSFRGESDEWWETFTKNWQY